MLPHKIRIKLVFLGLLVSFSFLFVGTPMKVFAVAPGITTIIVEDIPGVIKEVEVEAYKKPFQVAFGMIIWNLLQYSLNRVSYEFAVRLATGAAGGEPLLELRSLEDFSNSIVYDIVGEAIAALSEGANIAGLHFDLCAPSALGRINLQLGLSQVFKPKPRCDFQKALTNWTNAYTGIVNEYNAFDEDPTKYVLGYFADAINPRETELTASMTIYSQVFENVNKKEKVKLAELLAKQGYKDVADFISGNIKTPATVIALESGKKQLYLDPKENAKDYWALLVNNPEIWQNLGLSALSVFANTFVSTFLDNVFTGLYDVTVDSVSDSFDVGSVGTRGGVEGAEDFYKTIYTTTPISLDTYNAVSEFILCPTTNAISLNNCTMDDSFATAVGSADAGSPFTVQEAIEEGYINGDRPLISSSDSRNLDRDCYSYGYCYSNLVKLRKARIIPIGWEIAADLQSSDPDTLQDVVSAFDNCNADGERDTEYPYCHLIDPNWVLKYPSTQCEAQVAGQLVSISGADRQDECVDAPSCIQEDASGACVGGYGYCTQEKNVYQFRGQDCPEQYGTCLSFTSEDGDDSDLLFNTVDESVCDSNNAGCLWYETTKEEDSDGVFDWPTITDVPTDDDAEFTYAERVYFNSEVEDCDSSDAGCRRFVIDDDDTELNLIINPSFEDDDNSDDQPDFWLSTGTPGYDISGDYSISGDSAVNPGSGNFIYQRNISIQASMFYTLSFYAAQPSSSDSNELTVYLVTDSSDGSEEVNLIGTSYDSDNCELVSLDGNAKPESLQMSVTPDSDEYERFTCTFTSPTLDDPTIGVRVASLDFGGDLLVDAVQLEADEDVDNFREGYGSAIDDLQLVYYKLPPSYLGCEGSADDPEECDSYSQMCTAQDAGCLLYTPVNGNPSVPGITGDLDECPSECVGYDTYKQEPTLYEPDGEFPVYFISDTAISCSEQYVGCDEFTNLSDESQEYYTYLRACVTGSQTTNEAVYYTWEGSDLEGFKLQSWNLLKSDLDGAPCTSWETKSDGIYCSDVDADSDGSADTDSACDEHDDIFDEPDCREFYDEGGDISYRRFDDTVSVTDSCIAYRKTEISGVDSSEREISCESARGYFDSTTGNCRFYGYTDESDSCPSSQNGCREYTGGAGRNSSIVYDDDVEDEDIDEYDLDGATAEVSNESVATDGRSIHIVTTIAGGALFTAYIDYGSTCVTEDGCEASDSTLGFECTVEKDEDDCGTLADALAEDKVYVLNFWAKASDNSTSITPKFVYDGGSGTVQAFESVDLSTNWEEFTVGPLDTTDTDFDETAVLAFAGDASGDDFYIDNITLRQTEENITVIRDSWVTPSTCDETADGAESPLYYLGCQEYTDSNGDIADLKSFTRLCSEELVGCAGFFDTQASESAYGVSYNVRCDNADDDGDGVPDQASSSVVCEIEGETVCTITAGSKDCLFDWEGGEPRDEDGNPLAPDDADMSIVFGPETQVVNADEKVYFVANSEFECESSVMGCVETGAPTFSMDQTVVASWESTYLLNQPDEYDDQLCQAEALFCEAWDTTDGSTYFFKNPNDKTCEYKTSVSLNGTSYSGWFRTGTSEFCYGTGTCTVSGADCETDSDCTSSTDEETDECEIDTGTYLSGGTASSIWRNGDSAYDGWGGTCSAQYDFCTEFIDPADTGDELYGQDEGESYFFINDELLDDSNLSTSKQCNGMVSQKRGCVLFNDIVQGELTYNASASYIRSVHAPKFDAGADSYDLVDPLSCPDDGEVVLADGTEVDLCTQRCGYDTALLHPYDNNTGTTYTGSCLIDADCPDVESDGGDLVSGSCESDATALEDDTNMVQKVNLDRACAEWLACDSTRTVWDTSTNSYEISCDSVDACNEYSAFSDSSFCSSWSQDKTPDILTADLYSSRDVGWYGYEYAGYSIPNQIPAQFLSQVNINPSKWCVNGATDEIYEPYEDGSYLSCDTTEGEEECGDIGAAYSCQSAGEDYRLVYYAGACDGTEDGESCSIGFCSDTGSACGSDDECDSSEFCATGYCAYEPSSSVKCVTDVDCSGQTSATSCIDGVCQNLTSTACEGDTLKCSGIGTASCVQSASTQTGACYNDKCLLDPKDDDGSGEAETFEPAEGEELDCRGWPEANAPFGNSVVETWANSALGPKERTDTNTKSSDSAIGIDSEDPTVNSSKAYERKSTFERVTLCVAGEECDCSYDKVSYGSLTRYYDEGAENAASRVCSGGTYDGAVCIDSAVDNTIYNVMDTTCEEAGGSCQFITGQQALVGWQGYCLERDARTQVNGDSNSDACLTWLPLDQLSGASDIYGKYEEAGYPLTNTYYCGESDYYVDVPVSDFSIEETSGTSGIACAEHESSHDCWSLEENDDGDRVFSWKDLLRGDGNAVCPKGDYAVLGRCIYTDADPDTGDTDSAEDGDNYFAECQNDRGATSDYNDHPYICVPGDPEQLGGEDDDDVRDLYNETATRGYVPFHTDKESDYFGEPCYDPQALEDMGILDDIDGGEGVYALKKSDVDYEAGYFSPLSSDGNRVYKMMSGTDEFANLLEYYADCKIMGFDYAAMEAGGTDAIFDVNFDSYFNNCPTWSWTTCPKYWSGLYFDQGVYPACTTLVNVASTEGNRAWTNRLLYETYQISAVDDRFEYTNKTARAPFGAAWSPDELNETDWNDPAPARILSCVVSESGTASYLTEADGTCDSSSYYGFAPYYEDGLGDSSDPEARAYNMYDSAVINLNDFLTGISQIFAKTLTLFSWDKDGGDGTGGYGDGVEISSSNTSSSGSADLSPADHYSDVTATGDSYQDETTPSAPIVRSIGSTCVDDLCQEGSNDSFSINGYDDENLTGTSGQFLADIKFYVEANANQMPIRRMIIDWQDEDDGSDQFGSTSSNNYYKNARGLDEYNEEFCGESPENWGEEADACTSAYYNYSHVYTCTESFVVTLETCDNLDEDGDGLPDSTPCADGTACVYRPRIHVRDNWGWCTGECPDTETNPGNGDSCYGSMEDMDTSSADNECELERPDGNMDFDSFAEDDPWVYYEGVIRVEP
ncbi:MAG: hypothetical protein AAB337_00975 [Patescibacteria group bacterium]